MMYKHNKWLIVPACNLSAPEFRAAHNTLSDAYSGPEQRLHQEVRLTVERARPGRKRPREAPLDLVVAA